jgi:hypothetical protein
MNNIISSHLALHSVTLDDYAFLVAWRSQKAKVLKYLYLKRTPSNPGLRYYFVYYKLTWGMWVIFQYSSVKTVNILETVVETLHVTSLRALTEPYWVIFC